jgi:hypothetical protein
MRVLTKHKVYSKFQDKRHYQIESTEVLMNRINKQQTAINKQQTVINKQQ